MIQWHVFLSVAKHYNPYSGNFASLLTCLTTDYNPYSANLAGRASSFTCPITEFFKSGCCTIAVKVLGMLQHTNPISLN